MKLRLTSLVGGLLIVLSALITMVVYSAYTELSGYTTNDIVSIVVLWSSLCFPELAAGLKLFLSQESSTQEITDDDVIPVLIVQDVILTEEEILLNCPYCEYVFPDSEGDSGKVTCPNCAHLVVPMV